MCCLDNSLANRHSSNNTKMGMSFVYWSRKNPSDRWYRKLCLQDHVHPKLVPYHIHPYTMVPNSNSPLVASPSSLSPVTHSLNGTACCEMGGKCAKRSQCGASKGRKGVTSSECLGRNFFWCQGHQITNEEVGMSGAQLVIHGYPLWFFKQSAGMINIWCSNQNHKKWISTKVLNTLTFLATVSA